jgi:hypothetical protein
MNYTLKLTGFFLAGALMLTSFSCSKKTSSGPSTTELIAKSPWKFSKATANGVNISSLVTACIQDNLLTFNIATPANTGNLNEGATKCNAADAQQVDFNWSYDESFRKINITSAGGGAVPILPGGSNEFSLISVSETELVLSQTITYLGITQLVEATLVH